ncbi:MAG: DUF2384 domain-containing protein [Vicingus serpentipes]|jgi:uncharacterized protein (DUF2384 family)|nr:DUF2384 domain-containing protein [Vicingus serpentipes]
MKGKNSYIYNMKVEEKEKLKDIPSNIDNSSILNIIQSTQRKANYRIYFTILKSITEEDDKEISKWLYISEKTFRNYKTLETSNSKKNLMERIIMIIALFKHGLEVFGNHDKFKNWLYNPNYHFNNKAPITYIDTFSGLKFIDNKLTGMEYGDNA